MKHVREHINTGLILGLIGGYKRLHNLPGSTIYSIAYKWAE